MEIECALDYETRSTGDLKIIGPIEYSKIDETSILCVAYKINDGPVKLWIPERCAMPNDLWQAFQHGILIAHNAGFERAITKYCLTRYDTLTPLQKQILASIPVYRWKCTAAKAAMSSLPRALGDACDALELPIRKDMEGNRLMKKYMKPRKPSKHNPAKWWSDKKELRRIYRYCIEDVKAEYALDKAVPDLSEIETAIWQLDQVVNSRGILIDIPTVKLILEMIAEENARITKEVLAMNDGEFKPTQRAKMLEWLNAKGAALPNLTAGTIKQALERKNLSEPIRLMLFARQNASKTSTAKYIKMVKAVGEDNRARELLLYAGAVPTARWTGKRLQPHNLPRPSIADFDSDAAIRIIKSDGISGLRAKYGPTKVMDVLSSCIRGMFIASDGCELFCADFASVELNIGFWIAEHIEGLTAISEKPSGFLYAQMAGATFGLSPEVYLDKKFKETFERFIGKETMLGAQYGMGWKRFLQRLHDLGKTEVTAHTAKKAIYTYRKVHAPIAEIWDQLQSTIIAAIKHPDKKYKVTKVKIFMQGDFLHIKIPSGRHLKYYKPRLSQKQLASGHLVPQIHYWASDSKYGWCEVSAWGAIFFNHIVQGTARDFMAHGAMNIEREKYKFLLSVHDEALAEREKGKGNLKEFIKLMAGTPPAWGKDCPISAEGWVNDRYKK
jgi:DNA polymerase